MKAVLYEAPLRFAVTDVPTPQPGPDDVLIRVVQVGVCATDVHIHSGYYTGRFPLIPGHEVVGVVESMGPAVSGLRVGEQVSVNPNIPCGRCAFCRAGRLGLCQDPRGCGSTATGFSSTRPRRQAGSQGRSQVRPRIPGKTFDCRFSR